MGGHVPDQAERTDRRKLGHVQSQRSVAAQVERGAVEAVVAIGVEPRLQRAWPPSTTFPGVG
jgi:hypothetical protein